MPSTEVKTESELLTGSIIRRMSGLEVKLKSAPLESLFRFISQDRLSEAPTALNQQEQTGGANVVRLAGVTATPRPAPARVSWGNVRHYLPEMTENGIPRGLPGFSHGRFDMWGSRELSLAPRTPHFNFSILLAQGLGSEEGVCIRIPTVISKAALEQYVAGLNAGVRQLYIDYLKESTTNIRIYTEQFVTTS